MNYSEKLKDPRWQRKRLEVLERDQFTCSCCGDTEMELQVHHLSYKPKTEPWEYELENFQTLCKYCHLIAESLRPDGSKPIRILGKKGMKFVFTDDAPGCVYIYHIIDRYVELASCITETTCRKILAEFDKLKQKVTD